MVEPPPRADGDEIAIGSGDARFFEDQRALEFHLNRAASFDADILTTGEQNCSQTHRASCSSADAGALPPGCHCADRGSRPGGSCDGADVLASLALGLNGSFFVFHLGIIGAWGPLNRSR
jgi:hypothetical protein